MSRLRAYHDPFVVEGGCTCPGSRTLFQARIEGHTVECTDRRREAVEQRQRLRDDLERLPSVRQQTRRLRDAG